MTGQSTSSSRVLICDDQELIRMGLRMVIDSQPDLTVVGETADGDAAIAGVAALEPDLVLLIFLPPLLYSTSLESSLGDSGSRASELPSLISTLSTIS